MSVSTIVGGVVAVVVLAAATVLAWHGTITGDQWLTIVGGGGIIASVVGGQHVATKTGARAARREDL